MFVYLYLCESKYKINMFTIRKATIDDRSLIHDLASRIWENTYGKILSKEQLDYMFDMMYAPDNILKQMEELHHQYFIILADDMPAGNAWHGNRAFYHRTRY